MATNGDQFIAYIRGFRCGVAFRSLDPAVSEHPDEQIRTAYTDGWADGRVAVRDAASMAEKRYGYSPSVLRAADSEVTHD